MHFGIWRAFAVVFFSLCALVQNAISIPFVRRDRRLDARGAWLHGWCRFACRVLGIRIKTHGSMPSSGLLVSNHLSYLDIVVLSSIRPCVFVAKRDVARWPLFGWLAHAAGTIFVDRERRFSSPQGRECLRDAIATARWWSSFPKGQALTARRCCHSNRRCSNRLCNFAPRSQPRPSSTTLDEGSVAEEVCYWRDMTLVPHLLNLLFKREIRANYSFSPAKVRAGNRKEIARELRDEIVSMRS